MRFKVNTADHKADKPKTKHLVSSSFFCIFAYELLEVIIENLIITGISYLLLKIITTIFAVAGIHTIRVALKTLITKITYREGNDKMKKIKALFSWLGANKKSLTSTVVGAVGAGAGITASWTLDFLPQIMVNSFNIAPILYTAIFAVCFVLNELGICGKGFESVITYIARKATEEEEKTALAEQKAIEKAAQNKIKAEEAEKKAVEEAAQAKIEADKKAKEEAEFAKKVEAKKAEILKTQK